MTRGGGVPPAYNQHHFHPVPMFPGAQNSNHLQAPNLPGYRFDRSLHLRTPIA